MNFYLYCGIVKYYIFLIYEEVNKIPREWSYFVSKWVRFMVIKLNLHRHILDRCDELINIL